MTAVGPEGDRRDLEIDIRASQNFVSESPRTPTACRRWFAGMHLGRWHHQRDTLASVDKGCPVLVSSPVSGR